MFYDELELDDESPTPGTLGAPIMEEEEEGGKGTHDLRNLQDPENVWWCKNLEVG